MTDLNQRSANGFGTIGFIGLGAMGSRMIRHLKDASGLLLHDVDGARTRQLAAELSAEGVAARAASGLADFASVDVLILMLPDSAVVDQVFRGAGQSAESASGGVLSWLRPGTLVIDMGSSTPGHTVDNQVAAQARSVSFIDAPVSGGVGGAQAASLAIMVGASEAEFERARPLLQCLGSKVIRAGDVGSGHAVKALNNLLGATILAASAEVFAIGEKFGLDPGVMHSIVDASSGGSFMSNRVWPKAILPQSWDFGFALALMNKDVTIAMSLIESTGIQTELAQANAKIWADAALRAAPGADMSDIARQFRVRAGL
jgi:3-hydroxyisobutyrate dehydrogenase